MFLFDLAWAHNIKVSGEHHAVRWLKLVEFRGSSLCGCIWLLNFMSVMSVSGTVKASGFMLT